MVKSKLLKYSDQPNNHVTFKVPFLPHSDAVFELPTGLDVYMLKYIELLPCD